jgi:hypothetical protein
VGPFARASHIRPQYWTRHRRRSGRLPWAETRPTAILSADGLTLTYLRQWASLDGVPELEPVPVPELGPGPELGLGLGPVPELGPVPVPVPELGPGPGARRRCPQRRAAGADGQKAPCAPLSQLATSPIPWVPHSALRRATQTRTPNWPSVSAHSRAFKWLPTNQTRGRTSIQPLANCWRYAVACPVIAGFPSSKTMR